MVKLRVNDKRCVVYRCPLVHYAGKIGPMLATGNTAIAAIDRLKELSPKSLKFVCIVTCPEGVAAFTEAHPDVPLYTVSVDRELDSHGYIRPGLGDAGDRVFGTK
jgi:uracil phosphoribosyltransferase